MNKSIRDNFIASAKRNLMIPRREFNVSDFGELKKEVISRLMIEGITKGSIMVPSEAHVIDLEPEHLGLPSWDIHITADNANELTWVKITPITPVCIYGLTYLSRHPIVHTIECIEEQGDESYPTARYLLAHCRTDSLWAALPLLDALGASLDNPDGRELIRHMLAMRRDEGNILDYVMEGFFAEPIMLLPGERYYIKVKSYPNVGHDTILLRGMVLHH